MVFLFFYGLFYLTCPSKTLFRPCSDRDDPRAIVFNFMSWGDAIEDSLNASNLRLPTESQDNG